MSSEGSKGNQHMRKPGEKWAAVFEKLHESGPQNPNSGPRTVSTQVQAGDSPRELSPESTPEKADKGKGRVREPNPYPDLVKSKPQMRTTSMQVHAGNSPPREPSPESDSEKADKGKGRIREPNPYPDLVKSKPQMRTTSMQVHAGDSPPREPSDSPSPSVAGATAGNSDIEDVAPDNTAQKPDSSIATSGKGTSVNDSNSRFKLGKIVRKTDPITPGLKRFPISLKPKEKSLTENTNQSMPTFGTVGASASAESASNNGAQQAQQQK